MSASVDVENDVRHVVLPADDDDPEPLPWESIVRRLRGSGVLATVQELKQVPYDVVISERLRARIS